VLLLVLATTMLGAACHSGSSGPPTCDNPTSTDVVTLADFVFDPTCAAVHPGSTLTLKDTGGEPHTFTVSGTDVDVRLDAGQTQSVDLSGVAPGTYTVTCAIHPQMVGALKVG
jgi:plastocyanin